jgi:hypothetical protein
LNDIIGNDDDDTKQTEVEQQGKEGIGRKDDGIDHTFGEMRMDD